MTLRVVVDANVLREYYQVTVIGAAASMTGNPSRIFDSPPQSVLLTCDEGAIIENEWGGPVDHLWFKSWFAAKISEGKIQFVKAFKDHGAEKKIYALGFPRARSRDMWYVRTARGLLRTLTDVRHVPLVSEDMDFFDPSEKGCAHARRVKILTNGAGCVAKHLLRAEAIKVLCVCNS